MSSIRKTLISFYASNKSLKRFLACFFSYFFFLRFIILKDIDDINRRVNVMKKLGIIQNRFFVCLDMLFCDIFLGSDSETYATIRFNELSISQRLTFMPPYEYALFCKSINLKGNVKTLAEKDKTYETLKQFYCRDLIVIKSRDDLQSFISFAKEHKTFFYKPLGGTCGKHSGLANSDNINLESFFDGLINIGPFVIEELIVQCKELSAFHPSSVNTIRAVVFKSNKGSELLYGCLRCGQGGNVVDNGGSGGIFIPYNPETGRLSKIGFDENGNRFEKHPDTNIRFDNFQIPRFDEVKSLVLKATDSLPGLRYIGWDVAISKDKVMLVEGNHWPTILILEGLHNTGFKKELREIARTGLIPESFRIKQNEIFN